MEEDDEETLAAFDRAGWEYLKSVGLTSMALNKPKKKNFVVIRDQDERSGKIHETFEAVAAKNSLLRSGATEDAEENIEFEKFLARFREDKKLSADPLVELMVAGAYRRDECTPNIATNDKQSSYSSDSDDEDDDDDSDDSDDGNCGSYNDNDGDDSDCGSNSDQNDSDYDSTNEFEDRMVAEFDKGKEKHKNVAQNRKNATIANNKRKIQQQSRGNKPSNAATIDGDNNSLHRINSNSILKSNARQGNKKSNAYQLKSFSFNFPLMAFDSPESSCNRATCKFNGTCCKNTTLGDVISLRTSFWGTYDQKAPSQSERAYKIATILKNAWSPNTKTFSFVVGSDNSVRRVVCESAYLLLLGLATSSNAAAAPTQWKRLRASLVNLTNGGTDDSNNSKGQDYKFSKELQQGKRCKTKHNHAESYIKYIASIMGDSSPYAGNNLLTSRILINFIEH
jgi:hypothetical protein